MFAELISQADRAAALMEKAIAAASRVRGLRSGDPVFTPLIASAEFSQGSAPSANLVFNVPADADFWAYRLTINPYCKVVDPANGLPDEVAYRSTSFTGESMSAGFIAAADAGYTDFTSAVDGTFGFLFQGKELQNVDAPMAAAYSQNVGKWAPLTVPAGGGGAVNGGNVWAAASQTPGGLVFDAPLFIPRSKSIVLRITPTYLGIRSIVENVTVDGVPATITRRHKYKIVAVLEGEKKVSAFR